MDAENQTREPREPRYTRDGRRHWTVGITLSPATYAAIVAKAEADKRSHGWTVGQLLDEWYGRKLLGELDGDDVR